MKLLPILPWILSVALVTGVQAQQPAANPATPEVTTLSEVVVSDDAPLYGASEAATALKMSTPLLETPQAISVVPRQLIVDQGSRKLEDVLRNTAGVSGGGYFNDWDYYRIRGFDASFSTYVDGLITESSPGEELWNTERVEVVKGPASSLYGQGPLGGFVNIVSKRPHHDLGGEFQFTTGSWDLYEGALDINVPLLTPDGTTATSAKGAKNVTSLAASSGLGIYARLNALYKTGGSFADYANSERIFIAPSITFEFGPDTSLTLLTSYKEDIADLAFALPARGTVLSSPYGQIPVSRYVGNPALGNAEWERTIRAGYEFKHRFNDNVSLRQNFRYYWLDATSDNLSYPGPLDGRNLNLAGYIGRSSYEGLRVDTGLDFNFDTGPVKHSLTLGVDYRWSETYYSSRDAINPVFIDVFRPNYTNLPRYRYGPSYADADSEADLGFYLQEHAKLGEKWTVTLGGRFDHSTTDQNPGTFADDAFTPKAGLTYEITPGVAAYANYSRSYQPQWTATDASGAAVSPEKGENWETGVKYSLPGGKVTGMLSVYQLTRQNVATLDLATTDPFDSIVTGEQRSRGFEFETAAELAPGLSFTTAYTYIDAEVTKDNVFERGTRLLNVPKNTVNAWLKYSFQDGPLKGFGVGIGGRYQTGQAGDLTDSFSLPSYGLLDAALYYERKDYRVQVNFGNILDKRHFVGSYDEYYVLPGEPFSVRASVTVKF